MYNYAWDYLLERLIIIFLIRQAAMQRLYCCVVFWPFLSFGRTPQARGVTPSPLPVSFRPTLSSVSLLLLSFGNWRFCLIEASSLSAVSVYWCFFWTLALPSHRSVLAFVARNLVCDVCSHQQPSRPHLKSVVPLPPPICVPCRLPFWGRSVTSARLLCACVTRGRGFSHSFPRRY